MSRSMKTPGWPVLAAAAVVTLAAPSFAHAGRLGWLDDVLRRIVADARPGATETGRLWSARLAERGLDELVRSSAQFRRAAARVDEPAQALLDARFSRLIADHAAETAFRDLKPAEKRLVVEMGETAANLARRHPQEAEALIRRLGPEGLAAVRSFGDDVAVVLAQEGPECLSVLRKTGRTGWDFFTKSVLPHKKKLAAAGVLAAFLADPERFVDYAGKATQYAAREFARAGVALAGATASGLEDALGQALAGQGLLNPLFRKAAMASLGLIAALALLTLLGLPARSALRPIAWLVRLGRDRRRRG